MLAANCHHITTADEASCVRSVAAVVAGEALSSVDNHTEISTISGKSVMTSGSGSAGVIGGDAANQWRAKEQA
jgi:hypothetical protein